MIQVTSARYGACMRTLQRGITTRRRVILLLVAGVLAATVVQFGWVGITRLIDGPDSGCDRSVGSYPSGPLVFIVGAVLGAALLSLPLGARTHRKLALCISSGAVCLVSTGAIVAILGYWITGHEVPNACGSKGGYFGPLLPIGAIALISAVLFRDTLRGHYTPQPLAED